MNYLAKHRSIFIYGAALAAALFIMKWLEWRFLILTHAFEIYAGIIAIIFTGLGIWLALRLSKPKVSMVHPGTDVPFNQNMATLRNSGISSRELEVLGLMAKGLSNQEIADTMFLSLSTIKTHLSSVFVKLNVQRRTQAVQAAKKLGLIP